MLFIFREHLRREQLHLIQFVKNAEGVFLSLGVVDEQVCKVGQAHINTFEQDLSLKQSGLFKQVPDHEVVDILPALLVLRETIIQDGAQHNVYGGARGLGNILELLCRLFFVHGLIILHKQVLDLPLDFWVGLQLIILLKVQAHNVLLVHADLPVNKLVGFLILGVALVLFLFIIDLWLQVAEQTVHALISGSALCLALYFSRLALLHVHVANLTITLSFCKLHALGTQARSLSCSRVRGHVGGLFDLLLGQDHVLGHILLLEPVIVHDVLSHEVDLKPPVLLVRVNQVLDLELNS